MNFCFCPPEVGVLFRNVDAPKNDDKEEVDDKEVGDDDDDDDDEGGRIRFCAEEEATVVAVASVVTKPLDCRHCSSFSRIFTCCAIVYCCKALRY